jgi:hypothetical protein
MLANFRRRLRVCWRSRSNYRRNSCENCRSDNSTAGSFTEDGKWSATERRRQKKVRGHGKKTLSDSRKTVKGSEAWSSKNYFPRKSGSRAQSLQTSNHENRQKYFLKSAENRRKTSANICKHLQTSRKQLSNNLRRLEVN